MPSPASLALGVYSTRKWFSARSLHTSLTSDSVSTSVPSRSKMTSSTGCCCCCAPASGATAMPSGGGHPLAVCAVRPRGACGTPWYVRVLLCSPGCKRKAPDLWKRRRSDEKLHHQAGLAPRPRRPCAGRLSTSDSDRERREPLDVRALACIAAPRPSTTSNATVRPVGSVRSCGRKKLSERVIAVNTPHTGGPPAACAALLRRIVDAAAHSARQRRRRRARGSRAPAAEARRLPQRALARASNGFCRERAEGDRSAARLGDVDFGRRP